MVIWKYKDTVVYFVIFVRYNSNHFGKEILHRFGNNFDLFDCASSNAYFIIQYLK